MFIRYLLCEQLLIPAQQYTNNASKSIKNTVFKKYLFKIIKCSSLGSGNCESDEVICVKVESIEIVDNVLLRKSGEMKVKVMIGVIVIRLVVGEYFEGMVMRCHGQGIVVGFIGGMLEGTIGVKSMHRDTVYHEEKNQWIYAVESLGNEGYEWKIGAKVRVKVHATHWNEVYEGPESGRPGMADLIQLRADEPGLGPAQWWL